MQPSLLFLNIPVHHRNLFKDSFWRVILYLLPIVTRVNNQLLINDWKSLDSWDSQFFPFPSISSRFPLKIWWGRKAWLGKYKSQYLEERVPFITPCMFSILSPEDLQKKNCLIAIHWSFQSRICTKGTKFSLSTLSQPDAKMHFWPRNKLMHLLERREQHHCFWILQIWMRRKRKISTGKVNFS